MRERAHRAAPVRRHHRRRTRRAHPRRRPTTTACSPPTGACGAPCRAFRPAPRRAGCRCPPGAPASQPRPLRLGARRSAELASGGERAGEGAAGPLADGRRRRLRRAAATSSREEHTSRLSAHLHFGSLSAGEILARLPDGAGPQSFARQLCWRDFHHQVLAARPRHDARRTTAPRRPLAPRHALRRGLAGGDDRLPDRRCRDAPARSRGLHAQPRADDRRLVPDEDALHRLACRCRAFRGAARGRGRRVQHRQLAVGGRDRQRHQARTAS